MKLLRIISLAFVLVNFSLLMSCREAKEGADELADEVTGKAKLEKGKEIKDKLKVISDDANKQHSDALKSVTD